MPTKHDQMKKLFTASMVGSSATICAIHVTHLSLSLSLSLSSLTRFNTILIYEGGTKIQNPISRILMKKSFSATPQLLLLVF